MNNKVITPEQIEAWKKIHGGVYRISVGGKVGYLRKFDRGTLAFGLSQLSAKMDVESGKVEIDAEKMLKVGEIALKNCWLDGDEEILNDDSLFVSAAMQAGTLFEIEECRLEKL